LVFDAEVVEWIGGAARRLHLVLLLHNLVHDVVVVCVVLPLMVLLLRFVLLLVVDLLVV